MWCFYPTFLLFLIFFLFFFNDTATTEIYTLSLHDALPISIALLHSPAGPRILDLVAAERGRRIIVFDPNVRPTLIRDAQAFRRDCLGWLAQADLVKLSDEDLAFIAPGVRVDRKSTRLNSS